jgi:hypothetical protein
MEMPYSMFSGTLNFGGVELDCHILNDGRRVFSQRAIVKAISGGRTSGDLKAYIDANPLLDKGRVAADAIRLDGLVLEPMPEDHVFDAIVVTEHSTAWVADWGRNLDVGHVDLAMKRASN